MREIVLDTETTGLDPASGHRIVEIACLELVNHIPTGRHFQRYVNPDCDVPADAFAVHGLSAEFLGDKPRFAEIVEDLVQFIGAAPLVMHNAEFDVRFLNAEFLRLGRAVLSSQSVVDTLQMARMKFPGAPVSLDALCRRFAVDNSGRTKHGALLDTELLADVYLELIGGRQAGLELTAAAAQIAAVSIAAVRVARSPRLHAPAEAELAAHMLLVAQLKNPIWRV
ncbi:MAG: DNA polymerase III subunit epsilon [Dongiaceae bacterium]